MREKEIKLTTDCFLLEASASLKINSVLKSFVSFNLLRVLYRPAKSDGCAVKHLSNRSVRDGTGSSSDQIRLDFLTAMESLWRPAV